jgi:hypothetical protein
MANTPNKERLSSMSTKRMISHGTILLLLGSALGWAQQAQIGGLVPASNLGNSTAIPKPTLSLQGGTLILSDSPEQIIDGMAMPGAFYRDKVSGFFRVFYHHQNTLENDVSVGIAITNTSQRPEALFSHGRGAGVNYYPAVAGQMALSGFLSSRHATSFVALLLPGQSYYSTQDDMAGDTASGFEEYVLVSLADQAALHSLPLALLDSLGDKALTEASHNCILPSLPAGYGAGAATVTTLVYAGAQPAAPTTLPILPADDHIRGTFSHFDRLGSFTISAASGLQALAVSTAAPGLPWSNDMPGEYELGIDAVDSGLQVYNNGNYGVLYRFIVQIENGAPFSNSPMGILMQPTGGAGEYAMSIDRHTMLSPYVDYTSAWWFGELTSRAKSAVVNIETSLTGGSAGPQQLLFAPKFNGQ